MNINKTNLKMKMMKFILIMLCLGMFSALLPALEDSLSAEEVTMLIERTDDNASPDLYEAFITMKNYKPNRKTIENETHFYRKDEKMLAIYLSPAIQKGQAFIRNEDDMWMYLPNSKKITRIGAKDQSMGGEASNTDILRVDLAEDYTGIYLGQEKVDDVLCYKLELNAKKRTVAYDKVVYWISVEKELPVKREYYALSGKMLKIMYFRDVVLLGDAERPSFIIIENAKNNEYKTEMIYTEMNVNVKLNENIFTPAYIKKVPVL